MVNSKKSDGPVDAPERRLCEKAQNATCGFLRDVKERRATTKELDTGARTKLPDVSPGIEGTSLGRDRSPDGKTMCRQRRPLIRQRG